MVNKNIYKRRSIVGFSSRSIEDNILADLFEAARWAPSAFNRQPWRFIVGKKNTSTYQKIFDTLIDGNKEWAANAPVFIASIAEVYNKDRNMINKYAWHDTAMAYTNMVFQAIENDLYFHPMAGFSAEKLKESFLIPNEFEPVTVAALGYKSDSPNINNSLKERDLKERVRNTVNDLFYFEKWGNL